MLTRRHILTLCTALVSAPFLKALGRTLPLTAAVPVKGPKSWTSANATPLVDIQAVQKKHLNDRSPKILGHRPPIVGKFGRTYFLCRVGREAKQFHRVWAGHKLLLDGKDVTNCAFEVDMIGGWVGVLWEKYCNLSRPSKFKGHRCIGVGDYTRVWIRGDIAVSRQIRPPQPKVNDADWLKEYTIRFHVDTVKMRLL